MKGLVLAGGMGTRLRPFSYSMPKQLVPVANRPVLLHCLDSLRDAGITDVCVVVGDRGDEIRATVAADGDAGLAVSYVHQPAPLGLAHCVTLAREFLGDDDFVMYLGDTVMVGGIGGLLESFRRRRPAVQLALGKVTNPEEYGIAELDPDGAVVGLVEKPARPRSDLAVIGVYLFTPAIHPAIAHTRPSARGELEITDAMQWLIERGAAVRGERFDGYWKDTGRIGDLLDCNQHLLEATTTRLAGSVDADSRLTGDVDLAATARVVRSHVVGPVVIGADTVVEDSFVGPYTAIGARCQVARAGLEHSILLDGAVLRDVTGVYGSLIGRSAEVGRGGSAVRRHRLILGDHSRVQLTS
jgi:glucose-1-phosphate thymidylyltransferase